MSNQGGIQKKQNHMQSFGINRLLYIKRKECFLVKDEMIQIDACKNGDKESLGELYSTYAHKLLNICRHYVKDESAAEDILHDAFIIIFLSIKDLKDKSKLEGWMSTIVRNLSLKYLQSTKKKEILLSDLDIELSDETTEKQNNIDLDVLLKSIESLPEGNREVFKLSVLDNLSHHEIAKLLGIAPHSSSSQLSRAKKKLRTKLTNYWILLLFPVSIAIYIYFTTREKSLYLPQTISTTIKPHKKSPTKLQGKDERQRTNQPEYAPTPTIHNDSSTLPVGGKELAETKSDQSKTKYIDQESQIRQIYTDSLQKHAVTIASIRDSLFRLTQSSSDKLIALDKKPDFNATPKRKNPWTLNMGYSSNATGNNALTSQNYLSVVDYANGSANKKLYTWDDFKDYLDRNAIFMDSTERVKLDYIANSITLDGNGFDGKVHHSRPVTFCVSLNKQLNQRWIFGTGLTYTRLKSEFESVFSNTTLKKTQKIDYVGIPLQLSYCMWDTDRFTIYTTGGATFEIPVRSTLNKEYTIISEPTFMMKEYIKAHCQWSVNLGVGIQYKIFKSFSLYLEPNIFYYFRNNSGIETYRTEHPFTITFPFGLRFTW